jgi:SAM-dependent methyltransferase/DNA-directed RNA polymerase subunit RPC12/RpoP
MNYKCPICGSEAERVNPEGLKRTLCNCRSCNHRFVPAEVHDYGSRGMSYFNQNCNHQGIKSVEDSPEWDNYVNSHLVKLNAHGIDIHPGAYVIELGCLEGQVLNRLRHLGVHAYGYEPNKEVAHINNGFVSPFAITDDHAAIDGFADSIFSFHTFEHIDNIVETVDKCYQLLKPGGKMFFEIPFNETDWWNPDHVHFFNTHSISILMKQFHQPISFTGDHFINCHGLLCEQIQVSGVK